MSVTHTVIGGFTRLSGNPIKIVLIASEARTNHKLLVKVTCKRNIDNEELMGSPFIEAVTPQTLVSEFDISGLVNYPVDYNFTYPAVGTANPNDYLAVKAVIDIGESWVDGDGTHTSWMNITENNEFRILKGMLRKHELKLLTDAGTNFAERYINGGKFLTHLPATRKVPPTMIPVVWYFHRWPIGSHDFQTNIKVTTNQRTVVMTEDHHFYGITGHVEFAIHPEFQGFVLQDSEKIVKYEYWLTDADGEISEHLYFIRDYIYYESSFIVYFVNKLSGVDNIHLHGEHVQGATVENEIAYRPTIAEAGSKIPSLKTISANSQRTWSINTGAILREDALSIRDLLDSQNIWIVDPDNTSTLIPVTIEAGDFSLYDSKESIQNIEIKFTEAEK